MHIAFLILIIILSPFQDTFLGGSPLGYLGLSPAFIFVAVLLFISLLNYLKQKPVSINPLVFLLLFYIVVVNYYGFLLHGGETHYGEKLVVKGIKLTMLYLLFFFPFFINFEFIEKHETKVKAALFISIFILAAGYVFGDIFRSVIVENPIFHFNERPSSRPRGFSFEPSMFSMTALSLLVSIIVFRRHSSDLKISHFFTLCVVAVLTTSKGALVCVVVSFIFAVLCNKKYKGILLYSYIFFSLILAVPVGIYLFGQVVADIEESTSVATRMIVAFTAICSTFESPLGYGYAGYLKGFKEGFEISYGIINSIFGGVLNLFEVDSYLTAKTDRAIGTKSFFFNNIIVYGIPFMLFFVYTFFASVKACLKYDRLDLVFAITMLYCMLFLYSDGIGFYSIGVLALLIRYEYYKEKGVSF